MLGKGLIFGLVLALAGCGDPLAGVARLSDIDVVQDSTAPAALPTAEETAREGFFGTSAASGSADQAPAEDATPTTGGLFSTLFGGATPEPGDAEPSAADTQTAALAPEDAPAPRGGLFGGGAGTGKARSGPDALDVSFGTTLPFGEIARVCDAKGKKMGKKIDQLSRRGFALIDSAPGLLSKRTYYITGFSDGCPRQFTASNALLGKASTYEQFRFGPAGAHMPYAATDAAYDKVKSRTCGARKAKPCGSKIGRLDKSTAFISAYEFNEHNGRWKEFLVHDGEVVASALKTMN